VRLGPHRLSGMVAPMVVWAVHFVVVYSVQGLACAHGWQRATFAGQAAVTWWLLLVTAVMLAAAAAFGIRGWRAWRAARVALQSGATPEDRFRRFTAGITAVLSLIAIVAICFTAIPILLLQTCT
jgi:hypothetical protein